MYAIEKYKVNSEVPGAETYFSGNCMSMMSASECALAAARPARKIDLGLNESILVLIAAAVILFGAVLWTAVGPLAEKTDFAFTYLAARMVHQHEGAKLYDLEEQQKVKAALFKSANPLIYEHPPFEALVFAPLAALPYRIAYVTWGLVNALFWLAALYLLRPYAPVHWSDAGYVARWFFFAPLGVALFQGQSSLVLMLLYAVTFVSLKRGQDWRAGLWLGLGLFKFQFVLPFVLIFLLRRKWRFLGGFSVSVGLLAAASFIAVGWHGVVGYAHLLLKIGNSPSKLSYGSSVDMPTVQGFVYALFGHWAHAGTLGFMVAVISLSLVAFTAWRWRQQDDKVQGGSFDLMFAGAVSVALATGFHMFTHDFSPLILPLFLMASHFPAKSRPALRRLVGSAMAIFWTVPVYFVLVAWHCMYLMFPVLMVFGFSALGLAGRTSDGERVTGTSAMRVPTMAQGAG